MRKAQNGDQVSIEYEGMLEDGEIVERSGDTGPVEFELGKNIMPPGFEKALIGMQEGEVKTITLSPDEAFGPFDQDLIHTVNISVFGDDITPRPGMVLGMTLNKKGVPHKIPALVKNVQGEKVTLDFNHPLAGKNVTYKLTLKSIK